MNTLRKIAFILWLCLCLFIVIGLLQISYYAETGNYLMFNPEEVYDLLSVYAPLGFLIDIVVIGLIFRYFVRRQNRKREESQPLKE